MRILFLTQYFPPETGAPQNRLHSLALYFAGYKNDVTVLTAMPNYPQMRIFEEYRRKVYIHEREGPLTLHRSWIYTGAKKGVLPRLLNYFSFVFSAMFIGLMKIKRQDILICSSPPLFLAITAIILSKSKRAKLIFNVSDLWPESVEKLGIIRNRILLKGAYGIEKWIYHKSVLVTGQTKGIIDNIRKRYPEISTYWLPNGIDFRQFDIEADRRGIRKSWLAPNDTFVVLYAGILGHAQGLEVILLAAEILREKQNIKFILVGDGPERSGLEDLAKKKHLTNTLFISNRPRNEMPSIISACNAYIVPLKKLDLFLGAIPSKIFEPLAMGKPIILGVDGEARNLFIEKGQCGLFYEPENYSELAQCILTLEQDRNLAYHLGENGRNYVSENFDRAKIADEFHTKLIQLNK